MFWFVPLERLEERYTEQMYRWVTSCLNSRAIDYTVISGEPLTEVTEGHQFLSWASRVHFCSTQISAIAMHFHRGDVQDGDIFFIADFWHPGVEAIAYMRDLLGVDAKIYGINYAGPFDPTDLTRQLLYWGGYQEAAWYACFDKVFVGSETHKALIVGGMKDKGLGNVGPRIVATGLVWDPQDVLERASEVRISRPTVMWPHRLAEEKNPEGFFRLVDALAPEFPQVRWLVTSSRKGQEFTHAHPNVTFKVVSKGHYYGFLRGADLMVSTAYQETFGYTIREATALETPILCPRRACYPEMILSADNLYASPEELIAKTRVALTEGLGVAKLKPTGGFDHMMSEMGL